MVINADVCEYMKSSRIVSERGAHYWDEFLGGARRVLFLQGPIGPFFRYLQKELEETYQLETFKINFNHGDLYYHPLSEHCVNFTGEVTQFAGYLQEYITQHNIDAVICFGDERIYHKVARKLILDINASAGKEELTFWAFEEGYLRPHYITFEKWGVNYNSRMSHYPRCAVDHHPKQDINTMLNHDIKPVAAGFWPRAKMAMRYYWELRKGKKVFPNYKHHRETRISVYVFAWCLAGIRSVLYWQNERKVAQKIEMEQYGDFFVFPLQVHNDSQILHHGRGERIPGHIRSVIGSFAKYANSTDRLIIKHHPMDRGFNHYGRLITKVANKHGVADRVEYVFDVPMPVLLRAAKGVVVINSTSGISALIHGLPVKVIGDAHYDHPNLTNDLNLKNFWLEYYTPDALLVRQYLVGLKGKSQINGSFYHTDQLCMHFMSSGS